LRFFVPQGRHVVPMGVKFGTKEGTEVPSFVPNFTPSVQRLWYRTPKMKFLLRFDQNVEYNATPCAIFKKICRVCTTFQDASAVKIALDLLKGLRSHGGFKLRGSGYPQIFSAP